MMRKSEIFDNFIKIAEEKGMVSSDSEKSKKELEKNLRADSLSADDIAKLYNTKPNTPKDMEYKKNIMEIAHPKPVVVAPAYDKVNGLVENNIERQNIMINIVNKSNDAIVNHKKYAEKELLLSLVRVANDLDNQNKTELYSLADTCLVQLSDKKKLVKEAFEPITTAIVVSVAALLGGIYAKNHLAFIRDGFRQDHQKLIAEIDDLLTGNSQFLVGYDFRPEFKQEMQEFKNDLNNYLNIEASIEPFLDKLQSLRTTKQLMEEAKDPAVQEASKEANKAILAFRQATLDIWPKIEQTLKNFDNEMYKQRQITNKGFLTKLIDSTQILHGGWGLVADDFDDVKHALQAYVKDIKDIDNAIGGSISLTQNAMSQIQSAQSNAPGSSYLQQSSTSSRPGSSSTQENKPQSSVMNFLERMKKMFSPPENEAAPAASANDHVTANFKSNLETKLGIDQLMKDFDKNL